MRVEISTLFYLLGSPGDAVKAAHIGDGVCIEELDLAWLESMICTTPTHNKAQVTQRLPQLVPFITTKQAIEIYLLCCDFKHAAAAMLQHSVDATSIDPADQRRVEAVSLLHEAVRSLLLRALSEREFADTLVNVDKLRTTYQVFDSKGKLI